MIFSCQLKMKMKTKFKRYLVAQVDKRIGAGRMRGNLPHCHCTVLAAIASNKETT